MTTQKINRFLLILFGIIFLFGYIFIAYNNVYYGDDLHFIDSIRRNGIVNLSLDLYHNFECPLTLPFNLSLLYLSSLLGGVFLLNFFILVTNILAMYMLIKKFQNNSKGNLRPLLLSVFIIALMYSCTRSIGNMSAIFWGDAQLPYVLPMSYLFLWGYLWLEYKRKGGKLTLHFLGFLCLILMNTKLNYCLFFLTYISGFIFYNYLLSLQKTGTKYGIKTMFMYILSLLKKQDNLILILYTTLGLSFYVFNPGNFSRMKFDGHNSLTSSPSDYLKAILIGQKHFYLMVVSNLRFLAVLILTVVFVLTNIKYRSSCLLSRKALFIHFVAFTASLALQSVLTQAVFGTGIYQGRIFFLSEFLFLALFAHICYYFIRTFFSDSGLKIIYVISIPFVILILIAEIFFYFDQIKTTVKFKNAYNNRIAVIKQEKQKNRTEALFLEKLPSSGVLDITEISPQNQMTDSIVYYENKRIENFYNLPYKVYLRTNPAAK